MFLLAMKVKTLISEFTQFTIERCRGQTDFQASGNIVMHLMSKIPRNNWYKLFMENWYTEVPLVST